MAFWKDALAGTAGGVVGVWLGSPFDVIKTRLQASGGAIAQSALGLAREILAREGLRVFFRGAVVSSLSQAPTNCLIFGVYGASKRALDAALPPASSEPSFLNICAAGLAAGAAQSIVLAPFELIKVQQMLLGAGRPDALHPTLLQVAREIVAKGGARGLLRGLAATAVRDVPTMGLYFGAFEYCCHIWRVSAQARRSPPPPSAPVPEWVVLAGGGIAGVLSWTLALPADVVKTNIQGADMATPRAQLRFLAVGRSLLEEHGLAVFLRGAGPCIARSIPVNAVTFLVYSKALALLGAGGS